jgi:hypothetical protein
MSIACAHGAKINFGDLTPYLTFAKDIKTNKKTSKMFPLFEETQIGLS